MTETVEDVCLSHVRNDTEQLTVVNPTATLLEELIDSIESTDTQPPFLRIIGDKDRISDILNRFKIASQLAECLSQDVTTIHSVGEYQRNSMLLSDGLLSFYPAVEESEPAITQSMDAAMRGLTKRLDDEWSNSSVQSIRTPPTSRLIETMEHELGDSFKRDFESALIDIPEISTGKGEVSIITVVILIAARNGLMHYDLGHWSETVGLASKATISRKKSFLEDNDAISTSKVQQAIGRPRQKLHLNEEVTTTWDETNIHEAIQAVMD